MSGAQVGRTAGRRLRDLIVGGLMVGSLGVLSLGLAGCSADQPGPPPPATVETPTYRIGPLDTLNIFVWREPELTTSVPVRPDGRITTPLIEELPAAGRTPAELANEIEDRLKEFIQDPVVTVTVTGFSGPFDQQVRVVGEALRPAAIPYRAEMTALDVMVAVGGLTEFAAGNRAVLVRRTGGAEQVYGLKLDDLVRGGDISANAGILPGDIIIIPQSRF